MKNSNTNSSLLEKSSINQQFRLILFELSSGGHYPEYITHLINYWINHQFKAQLILVVSPLFVERHPEVVAIITESQNKSLHLVSITKQEEQQLSIANKTHKRIIRAFQEFNLARRYVQYFDANHILFTYFDTRQIPLALSKTLPCSCSGIYFRPRFHYHNFIHDQASLREKIARWQEKLLITQVLKNNQVNYVFSLDSFAVKQLNKLTAKEKAISLADPIQVNYKNIVDCQQLKANLQIEEQRKIFLLFGGLTKRKGILPLLDALAMLSSEQGKKICILLVGFISEALKQQIQPQIDIITQKNLVQFITEYRYVSAQETQAYFQLADVVLALYQRHVGMSGILMHAAANHKPVLSSNYGLMGAIANNHQLGLTVDSTDAKAILEGLTQFLLIPNSQLVNDNTKAKMKLLVEQNSPTIFAQTILETIIRND